MYYGKDYPGGIDYVRRKAKEAFRKMEGETDPAVIEKEIKRCEWIITELEAIVGFHKYRAIKRMYDL